MQRPPILCSAYIRIERRCLLHPPETVKQTDVMQCPELCSSVGARELNTRLCVVCLHSCDMWSVHFGIFKNLIYVTCVHGWLILLNDLYFIHISTALLICFQILRVVFTWCDAADITVRNHNRTGSVTLSTSLNGKWIWFLKPVLHLMLTF